MKKKLLSAKKNWVLLLIPIAFLSFKIAIMLNPGLDYVEAIDPFMNGNLPTKNPFGNYELIEVHTSISKESPQAILPFPGTDKLLYVEMDGRFYTIPDNDNAQEEEIELVLDIQDLCWYYGFSLEEGIPADVNKKHGGFQNVIFHPKFGMNEGKDYIYVYYVHNPFADDDTTSFGQNYYDRLSRFTWNGSSFDKNSELIMINQYDTAAGHDGGGLVFDNDGFLYISIGDEGTFSLAATEHTQTLDDRFRSGVWRMDVDMQGGEISHPIQRQPNNDNTPPDVEQSYTQGYYIPSDNPWITETPGEVLEEYYAVGLRQPFRMTYDAVTNNIWLGDVGGEDFEEVNLLDQAGLNFEWNFAEGDELTKFRADFYNSAFQEIPDPLPGERRGPIYAYPDAKGSAVIGGYVYRGTALPFLEGKYIFGDNVKGTIHALTNAGGNSHSGVEDIVLAGTLSTGFSGISSFGYTHENELLVLQLSSGKEGGGKIFKLVKKDIEEENLMPELLSDTGVFSDMQNLTPAPGVLPYDVVNPLWSSGTDKSRWVSIPQDGIVDSAEEQIGYSEDGIWTFPVGTTFIKHFANPDGTKLETRLWIRAEDEIDSEEQKWYGSTYKWRADGLEADLLTFGANEDITIDGETFNYEYPDINQCAQCHNKNAGYVLGFSTRQLNRDIEYESTGRTANQLETLHNLGFIPQIDTESVSTLAPIDDNNVAVETRVRSYFDSNCAYCHQPGNTRAGFDMQFSTALIDQNLINGSLVSDFIGDAYTISPASISKSMIYHRLNSLDPSTMMPPSAKGRVDTEALQLLEAWINSLAECNDNNQEEIGNKILAPGGNFIDIHSPNINISRTGQYTNSSEETINICIEEFSFYASEISGNKNPLTPFIVKVNSENDFTVVSIGQTRTSSEYITGFNTFNFSDHTNDMVQLLPGESLAPGFMDAYPDGSGSFSGGSVIPAIINGDNAHNVWQTYLNGETTNIPHIKIGSMPTGPITSENLARTYQFNIGINISNNSAVAITPVNLALGRETEQSSTSHGAESSRAVDGNYSGLWGDDSVTHTLTTGSENPYWRVDLGSVQEIGLINIFNRTDECCADRLDGAKILISNTDSFNIKDYYEIGVLNSDSEQYFDANGLLGQYVMVYLEGTNKILSLAEVEVFEGKYSRNPVATVYRDSNYEGQANELSLGYYPDITTEFIGDDTITSLQINEGYYIELYSELNFEGDSITLDENVSFLLNNNFNDVTSSIKIYQKESIVTFYEDDYFNGTKFGLYTGEYADITLEGIPENSISSLHIQENYIVELFTELDFGGDSIIIDSNSSSLYDFNNNVSSVKIYQKPYYVTLFDDGSFLGDSYGLFSGEYADIEALDIPENSISSLQIQDGYIIELFTEKDFEGESTILDSNVSFLGNFNDKLSSIKIYEKTSSTPSVANLYQHSDFIGISFELPIGEYPDITLENIPANYISSLQIEDGYIIELYTELDFEGESTTLSADTNFLGEFNDIVSSIKLYKKTESNNNVTLYEEGFYEGESYGLSVGEFHDLTVENIPENSISSLQIEEGYYIELYTEKNFEGETTTIDTNTSFLNDFNDNVSSIKIFEKPSIVYLYSDYEYTGDIFGLSIGEFPDLTALDIPDNDISSLQIQEGYYIEVYTEKNFEGETTSFDADTYFLFNFNDDVSSIKVFEKISLEPTYVTLYKNGDYNGNSYELPIGDYPDLTAIGIPDNDISSLQIQEGYYVELYSEKNFEGETTTIDINTAFLAEFNDIVSSLKVIQKPSIVELFKDGSYGGESYGLPIGDFTDITLNGIPENDISSLQIQDGYIIELYTEKDFQGESTILNSDSSFLYEFNDIVSSIKVYEEVNLELTYATLYKNGNYDGASYDLSTGDYEDVTLYGIPENDISSLQIQPGYYIELYSEKNFEGESITFDTNTSFLEEFNDIVSSIKIIQKPSIVYLYEDGSFGGNTYGLPIGDYSDLSLIGVPDNNISSLQIQDGYIIELYSEKDFEGEFISINADSSFLYNFNDIASSVKIYEEILLVPTFATLYSDGNYEGASFGLPLGEYEDLEVYGIPSNSISSLQIQDGYIIELYSEKDFEGEFISINSDSSFLYDFNDTASSVKIYEEILLEPVYATLYVEDNYEGAFYGLSIGEYEDLEIYGISDNSISSLQIEDGYIIELYTEKDFEGDVIILEKDSSLLNDFDNTASSIKLYEKPIIATLYSNGSFSGINYELTTGEYPDITLEGITDNDISSLQITDGYTIELYTEKDFEGDSLVLEQSQSFLNDFNDLVSSIKIYESEIDCSCKCASGEYNLLINGSFEETSNPNYETTYDLIEDIGDELPQWTAYKFLDAHPDEEFPGWFTTGEIFNPDDGNTSEGGTLELMQSKFLNVEAAEGNVFAEMDGNHHHQIVSVTSGQILDWEISHRGREGVDEITVSAGPIDNQTTVAILSSPNGKWTKHTGQYQVPDGVTEIQFTITPSGASNDDMDSSNYLDDVRLCSSVTAPISVLQPLTETEEEFSFVLYPNSVDDVFYLQSNTEISGTYLIQIHSSIGLLVQQEQVIFNENTEVQVDVTNQESGIYYVSVFDISGENKATLRMLKN